MGRRILRSLITPTHRDYIAAEADRRAKLGAKKPLRCSIAVTKLRFEEPRPRQTRVDFVSPEAYVPGRNAQATHRPVAIRNPGLGNLDAHLRRIV